MWWQQMVIACVKKKQMVIATAKIFMASNDCKNTNISLRKGYFHKIKFGVVRQQTKLGCGNRLLQPKRIHAFNYIIQTTVMM
jgi:hypothetical protein